MNASIVANNLSELTLTIGDVKGAITYAEQSVEFSERTGQWDERMKRRTTIGDALHQAGRFSEAKATFGEAEEIQKKGQPDFPFLYSWFGFKFCDLLLSQGNYAEVE